MNLKRSRHLLIAFVWTLMISGQCLPPVVATSLPYFRNQMLLNCANAMLLDDLNVTGLIVVTLNHTSTMVDCETLESTGSSQSDSEILDILRGMHFNPVPEWYKGESVQFKIRLSKVRAAEHADEISKQWDQLSSSVSSLTSSKLNETIKRRILHTLHAYQGALREIRVLEKSVEKPDSMKAQPGESTSQSNPTNQLSELQKRLAEEESHLKLYRKTFERYLGRERAEQLVSYANSTTTENQADKDTRTY